MPEDTFKAAWGNIFTRTEWKDDVWSNVLNSAEKRSGVVGDIFDELDEKIMKSSALYNIILENKPDIIIDCINTATAIAYLDIYTTTQKVKRSFSEGGLTQEAVERLMVNMYIPQLIRHIQFLYNGMLDVGTSLYLKIGTSGTGGMGLNIPYTHSEERPSRVLLSKSAVAGAQSLLLFLMARTPNGPMVKEIKPTAAIAWKRIAYGEVMRKGRPIPLVDMPLDKARPVTDKFIFEDYDGIADCGRNYQSVFIDTGENGIFSKGEFESIGALGQMEIVTPEEIATYAVHEILGGNTGKDVIQGLDAFTLGPTYRGGMLYNKAVAKLKQLEIENDSPSVAFEMLGPPRLSKLLFEAFIIKKMLKSMKDIFNHKSEELSKRALELLEKNTNLRSQMLSIGLVVLLPDGKSYLRGKDVKIPSNLGQKELPMTEAQLNKWCWEAWVDLRPQNFDEWKNIIDRIMKQAESIDKEETSSRYTYTTEYWNNFDDIDEGKIVAWVFEHYDKGWRFKR